MNSSQIHWWTQAQSDFRIYRLLVERGENACHSLHYLQMVAEKISKAYFWKANSAPPKSHLGFVQYLRALGQSRNGDPIAKAFGFARYQDFQTWIRQVSPLAYELERLAPALAQNGPNPEYPWPHESPQMSPASFSFPLWQTLLSTGHGRGLLQFVERAVTRFPVVAGL